MYKRSEVEKVALEYFDGDTLVANVWMDKYALKTSDDEFLEQSPDDTIVRLAKELFRIEMKYPNPVSFKKIYDLLSNYEKFVLGGSSIFGIGNTLVPSTLGNCFVVDSPYDSFGGIFKTDQELAQLMKRRGGVGVDISTLRKKGAKVNNAANASTGAVSFMEQYSDTTRRVAQEGRRGALMLTMDVNHPDIEAFVTAKNDSNKITGANISVRISDDFMQKIRHTHDIKEEHKVWGTIIHQAWKSAEPGVIFWDKIINNSPADCYPSFKTISTNPCGELPLCAYDSCRISAINLYAYVLNPFTGDSGFDLPTLGEDSRIFQRLMDDIVDLEEEKISKIIGKIITDPEPEEIKKVELDLWSKIRGKLLLGRRTGLGQMGLADAGAALGLQYGSNTFKYLAHEISRIIATNSYIESINLAKERGKFPLWDKYTEQNNPFIEQMLSQLTPEQLSDYNHYGRRNIANLTVAPTGTISMLAKVSSGIEPVYSLSYNRKRKVTSDNPNKKFQDKQGDWWEEYTIFHPKYQEWIRLQEIRTDYDGSGENFKVEKADYNNPKHQGLLIATSPYHLATAYEVNPYEKINLQSVIQKWIDHSISVTYNLPSTTTEEEISKLYMTAWEKGLKGITVYRDGCREGILTTKDKFHQHDAIPRPKDLPCDVYLIKAQGRDWKVFIGLMDNLPYEVFAVNGTMKDPKIERGIMRKIGGGRYNLLSVNKELVIENITENMTPTEEALTRTISWALRHGAKLQFGVEQLNKSTGDITSFSKAIARTFKKYLKDVDINRNLSTCPNCGNLLRSEGGCEICKDCGYSRCG